MSKDTRKASHRPRILVMSWPDYYLEIFSDARPDIHVCRIPLADTPAGECAAEDIAESLLPYRFRELFSRDKLVTNATTRPLTPDALAHAIAISGAIDELNDLGGEEVQTWTL